MVTPVTGLAAEAGREIPAKMASGKNRQTWIFMATAAVFWQAKKWRNSRYLARIILSNPAG
jgi:hypothetical protein